MSSPDDVYRRLQENLDRMPIPFPPTRSGVDLRLLKQLFTPEEAEVAAVLNALPEPVEKIRRRLRGSSITAEELRSRLARMTAKGVIQSGSVKRRGSSVPGYSKIPLAIGMFELQVGHLTRDIIEAFHAYEDEGFANALITKKTPQIRTVPINTAVGEPGTIGRYDNVRAYIRESPGPFAVMNCVCREGQSVLGHRCTSGDSHETCLTVGTSATYMHELGPARLISRDEVLAVLERAEGNGLVLQPQNTQSPQFICCCCRDCCEVLAAARKLSRPSEYLQTNSLAVVNDAICVGCKTCVKRCPMEAVTVEAKVARVDRDRCIGCGLCASTCKEKAIRLQPRGEKRTPPRDQNAMYQRIMMDRYGPLRTLAKGARMMLGMKL